jgi:hypothetical protein
MKRNLIFLLAISFAACTPQNQDKTVADKSVSIEDVKKETVLNFINDYVKNCNRTDGALPVTVWADSSLMVSNSFKMALTKLIDDAYAKDPVLGLGADPLFDAQDYPAKGFELETFDKTLHYYTVKGIDWPDFKLNIKLIEQNGKWLVDGCGLVNIPAHKQIKR